MANPVLDFVRRQAEAKALADHRFFHETSPYTVYAPGQTPNRERGLISQREAKHHLTAYGGSEAMDWVMDCISFYCEPAGAAAYHFEDKGKRLVKERREDTPDDVKLGPADLYKLFEQPNPWMDYDELMQLMVIDLLLVGNAYWYKYRTMDDGKPLALYRLSPGDVKVVPGAQGPDKYVYDPAGAKQKLTIDPSEVIHFKRPNPHNPYYGLGIIKGAGRAADMDIAITDAMAHYFENKADPSLIVQSERRVPRDVFKKLRAQLRARIGGRHNAGELLVLEAGLKAETLSPNAKEAAYKELSEMSRDRVLAWFKVNPKLLGVAEVGTAGDKVQDARREFSNHALRPFLDRIQTKITRELVAAWDLDYVIDYEYTMAPEDLVKLSGDFASTPGVKVIEIRDLLVRGGILREATTGDKEIDETVLNLPGEELDDTGQGGFADRNLPREPGRPPAGDKTRSFPRGGGPLPAGSKARRPAGKALETSEVLQRLRMLEDQERAEAKAVPNLEDVGRTTVGNKLPDEDRPTDVLAASRTREVDLAVGSLESRIMDCVTTLERNLLDQVEGKAFDPKASARRVKNSAGWRTFQQMLKRVLVESAETIASIAAIQHAEQGIVPDEALDYSDIAESVVNRPEGVRAITANLKGLIVKQVDEAAETATREELNAIIRQQVDYWRQHHAETVAMTEAVETYNEATLSVLEGAGRDTVFVEDGHDHDEACAAANGSVWTIDFARKNRSEHPRCRRAFVPLESST